MNSKINRKYFLHGKALLMLLFLLTCLSLKSQTAKEFFVGGANFYINSQIDKAKELVSYGLSKYPDDKKLQALKKRIEEEKPEKNQDQKQKQKQDQNKDQKQPQQQQEKDKQRISKEDAQRLLDALANDEKKVQEKVKLEKAAKERVSTIINW